MNMNNVTIRLATVADADFIVDAQIRMAYETEGMVLDKAVAGKGVEAIFRDPLKGFYIVGETDSQVLCSCLMITPEWSDWRNNWVWWIQSVYVVPAMRKLGVFGTMYDHIKTMVKQRDDIAGIRLYVDNTNLNAREVYSRVGMTDQHYRLFEWMK